MFASRCNHKIKQFIIATDVCFKTKGTSSVCFLLYVLLWVDETNDEDDDDDDDSVSNFNLCRTSE